MKISSSFLFIISFIVGFSSGGSVQASPGDLDPGFGSAGLIRTDAGDDEYAYAVAVQPDGKIVAAGSSGDDFVLTRYDAHGELDADFGVGGKVKTDFPAMSVDWANAVLIQPDGKILAAGVTDQNAGDFALARYEPDGDLDPSFSGGRITTDFLSAEYGNALALQPDGKILLVGQSNGDFALARYEPDGDLDPDFGAGGRVITDVLGKGKDESAQAIVLQPDGKILMAGQTRALDAPYFDIVVARYETGGALDATFGVGGVAVVHGDKGSEGGRSLAVQSDGRILIGGYAVADGTDTDFAVVRLLADGTLDDSFGAGGMATTDLLAGNNEEGYALLLQPDGRILLAGQIDMDPGTEYPYEFALARYDADGALDATFGSGGKSFTSVVVDPAVDYAEGYAAALQDDGKIVMAGSSYVEGLSATNDFIVARFLADAADLGLAIELEPASPIVGGPFSLVLTVINHGPQTATGVSLDIPLPEGLNLESFSASQGACEGEGSLVCDLGSLAGDAKAAVTLFLSAAAETSFVQEGVVGSMTPDPEPSNDAASFAVTVDEGTAEVEGDGASGGCSLMR